MKYRLRFAVLALTAVAMACAHAHSFQASTKAPAKKSTKPNLAEFSAEQIIERSIQAIGGRGAYEKVTSSYTKAIVEFTAQHAHSTLELYSKAPDKWLLVTILEGYGEVRQGYDGKTGWSEDPENGVRELTGANLEQIRRDATFNPGLAPKNLYRKLEVIGRDTVGNREVYVVRLTPAKGKPNVHYYDAETFLLLRQDLVQETADGPVPVTALLSDYRDANGIKVPFRIEQRTPMGNLTIRMVEVRNNLPIDDSVFAKPDVDAKPAAGSAPGLPRQKD